MNRVLENIDEFIPDQTLKDKHEEAKSLALVKLPEQSGDEGLVQASLKTLKSVSINFNALGPLLTSDCNRFHEKTGELLTMFYSK
jgi:hypothetical protein